MNQQKIVFGWIYAAISFSLLLWLFFITYRYLSSEHQMARLTESIGKQTEQLLSQGNHATFGVLESFLGRHRDRNELSSLVQHYENSVMSKTILKNRADEHQSRALQVISGYDRLYRGLSDHKDELGRDNMAVTANGGNLSGLLSRTRTQISSQTELPAIRALMAEAEQMENTIDRLSSEMERKKISTDVHDPVTRVVNNIYRHYTVVLQQNKRLTQQLRNSLGTLSRQQEQQLRSLLNVSAEFNANTGNVQLLHQQLSPLTRNLREWADPVRSGVDAMNTSIMPGVTALSLLRQIDPLSAQTIVMMGELANQAVALDSEIQQLAANVVSLRESGNRFSSSATRANALRFTEQASGSASYLQSKRDVFTPIYQRLETANNQLNRLDSSIASVRNARARNMLHDLNLRSKLMVAQMARPLASYQDLVDRTVRDLNQLVAAERTYSAEVEKLRSTEFVMTDLNEASAIPVPVDNLPFHSLLTLILIFIGVGFANMFVVYLMVSKPKSGKRRGSSKVPGKIEADWTPKSSIENLAVSQPGFTASKSSTKEKVGKPDIIKPAESITKNKQESIKEEERMASPAYTDVKQVSESPKLQQEGRVNPEFIMKPDMEKSPDPLPGQPLRLQQKMSGLVQLPGCLKLLDGVYKEKHLLLYGKGSHENGLRVTIGRGVSGGKVQQNSGKDSAHIALPDTTNTLSRVHFEIRYHLGELLICNLSSSNPAMVDGFILKEGEAMPLKDGSTIAAGYVKMQYLSQA